MSAAPSLRATLQMALYALENSIDCVREEYVGRASMWGGIPTRQKQIDGLKADLAAHEAATETARTALALPEAEPVARCGVMRAGCNYLATCGSLCRKCGSVHTAPQPAPVEHQPLSLLGAEKVFEAWNLTDADNFYRLGLGEKVEAAFMDGFRAGEAAHNIK